VGTTKGRRRVLAVRGGFDWEGRSLPEVPSGGGAEDVPTPKMQQGCGAPEMAQGGGAKLVSTLWRANSSFRCSIRVDRQQCATAAGERDAGAAVVGRRISEAPGFAGLDAKFESPRRNGASIGGLLESPFHARLLNPGIGACIGGPLEMLLECICVFGLCRLIRRCTRRGPVHDYIYIHTLIPLDSI
jgi:hypothetical protein